MKRFLLALFRRIFPVPDPWEDGSIEGLPARRNRSTWEVQMQSAITLGKWTDIDDPLNKFLPLSQKPRTPAEWNERLCYVRMRQPQVTERMVEDQFERCRRAPRRFPAPRKTSKD